MNGLHGIIFSYMTRKDLRELSAMRSPTSVPFGGRYRAVDFSLSNLMNAGVTDVGMVLNGRYQSILDHVGSGKIWDLSRKRGGLHMLPPFNYQKDWGVMPFRGKMEALIGVKTYLDAIRQDYVVMMDGDLIANIPLQDALKHHIETKADITVVCANDSYKTEDGTYFEKDADGRVTEVLFHLNQPRGYRGLEIYILSTDLLRRLVAECEAQELYSFRSNVLLERRHELNIQMYTWTGFAAQISSVQEYYERSMQLLDPEIRAELFPVDRPVRAKGADKTSTYISETGSCLNSLVAEGCWIEGTVVDSILFPGVTVAKGAVVRNSILFKETTVGENATLAYAIADKEVTVGANRTLMGHSTYPIILAKKSVI